MIPRQQKRRAIFQAAFIEMPLWATWTAERAAPANDDPDKMRTMEHCKAISRRVRRSMARVLVKRRAALSAQMISEFEPMKATVQSLF